MTVPWNCRNVPTTHVEALPLTADGKCKAVPKISDVPKICTNNQWVNINIYQHYPKIQHTIGTKNNLDTKESFSLDDRQEKHPVILVIRNFACPQADGKLKNVSFCPIFCPKKCQIVLDLKYVK